MRLLCRQSHQTELPSLLAQGNASYILKSKITASLSFATLVALTIAPPTLENTHLNSKRQITECTKDGFEYCGHIPYL